MKSTVEEIKERFDKDVERFSNLRTGQSATIDAPLVMELITQSAAAINPNAKNILDIGCGAGNYTLKLYQYLSGFDADLVDLSQVMLDRAMQRIQPESDGKVKTIQGDIRDIPLETDRYDIVMAAATLHHLRNEEEWEQVFTKIYRALKPGGSFWISDMIKQSIEGIQVLMWQRYGKYLEDLKNEEYREHVFSYIEKEDTPQSVMFQIDLMRKAGFSEVDIIHKHLNFAAFVGIK